MVYLFKDIRIKYTITNILLLIALIAVTLYSAVNTTFIIINLSVVCYCCMISLFSLAFNKAAQKRLNKIIDILTEECDPYRYIEQLLPLTQKKIQPNIRVIILIYLACGYIDAGDNNQAKIVLSDISKIGTNNKINLSNISNLLTVLYLDDNDLNNARLALADFWKYSNQIKSNDIKYQIKKAYNRQAAKLNMMENNLYGVEEIYKAQLEGGNTVLEKNILYYDYALLCIKQNRIDEAKKALQFVIENGNKLHLVTKAKEKLAQL